MHDDAPGPEGHGGLRPLDGIRVLDLSRIFAAPFAGQILADLGAEVIKVERPGAGDDTRTWGPPFVRDPSGAETAETGYFLALNRGKKSVTIDIGRPEGQALLRDLAERSDVLIENFKPGTLDRYGVGWTAMHALNPRLVYCAVTGFGQDGPYRDRPAYDFIIQAMGGLMSVTGEREDRPGGGPQKVGVPLVDLMTGLFATVAVQAALAVRQRTGQGQHIDIGMLDVLVGSLANQAQNYLLSGRIPRCAGNDHPNIVPQRVFAAGDGKFVMVVGNDGQFRALCAVLGRPDLATDPRFATNPERVRNRVALDGALDPLIAARTVADLTAALDIAGVPCGPINDMQQVFTDPQVLARAMQFSMAHPTCGAIPQVANPIRLGATPIAYPTPPPVLGQHVEEVLGGLLGLSPEHIASLRKARVI